MKWFFDRMQEASTFAALSSLGIAGNMALTGNWEEAIFSILTGVIAIFKKEGK